MSEGKVQTEFSSQIFAAPRHFTACADKIMLLKKDVDFVGKSGFAPGFFEGKPRGKKQHEKYLSKESTRELYE